MDTKNLQPGHKIGIIEGRYFKYPDASIETIDRVTPSGQVIIGHKRFNKEGYLMGDDNKTTILVSVEEAQEIIATKEEREKKRRQELELKAKSPEGIARKAVEAALEIRPSTWLLRRC